MAAYSSLPVVVLHDVRGFVLLQADRCQISMDSLSSICHSL